jgi:hypothetical protein
VSPETSTVKVITPVEDSTSGVDDTVIVVSNCRISSDSMTCRRRDRFRFGSATARCPNERRKLRHDEKGNFTEWSSLYAWVKRLFFQLARALSQNIAGAAGNADDVAAAQHRRCAMPPLSNKALRNATVKQQSAAQYDYREMVEKSLRAGSQRLPATPAKKSKKGITPGEGWQEIDFSDLPSVGLFERERKAMEATLRPILGRRNLAALTRCPPLDAAVLKSVRSRRTRQPA